MDIHCDGSSGLWSVLPDKHFAKSCKIRINPTEVLSADSEHVNSFIGMFYVYHSCTHVNNQYKSLLVYCIDYLAPMLAPANLNDLLESSDVVGNIRFSHPTLYVFPGGQGDAALFGINGFNMLGKHNTNNPHNVQLLSRPLNCSRRWIQPEGVLLGLCSSLRPTGRSPDDPCQQQQYSGNQLGN